MSPVPAPFAESRKVRVTGSPVGFRCSEPRFANRLAGVKNQVEQCP